MGEDWAGSTHPSWALGQEQDKAFYSSELSNLYEGGRRQRMPRGGGSEREAHFSLRWEIQEVSEMGNKQGDSYGRLPQARDTFLAPSSITGVEPNGESRGAPQRALIVVPSVMGATEDSGDRKSVV